MHGKTIERDSTKLKYEKVFAVYESVLKGYGKLATSISRKKIYEDTSDSLKSMNIFYEPSTVLDIICNYFHCGKH
jgi:hypothetical protein